MRKKIKGTVKEYKNLWFNASLIVGEHEMPLGRFFVYEDKATSDRQYRDIVAYDKLFLAMNTDVTEWYNGLSFPITIKNVRNSLFNYLGIEQEEIVLANDNVLIGKTVDGNGLTGKKVIEAICELNACFGCINNVGKFRYVKMRTIEHDAIYPSETLYPSESLYPNDLYDDYVGKSNYYHGSLTYEEYSTKPITKVVIRENLDDVGYSVGENGNTYVIEDNFLMYGADNSVLSSVANGFLEYAQHVSYTPCKLKCKGTPWREVGDLLEVVSDEKIITMPILNRVLSGIIALKDDYEAKGTETYGEVQNHGIKADLKQLKGRTNSLVRTIDETRSEITRLEADVNGELTEMQSSITQNATSITSEVTRAKGVEEQLSTKITQNANSISTKVSKGSVSSEISQEADKITISGDRFILNASNISIDANGNVTIKGKLTANEGSQIASWATDVNSLYSGTWATNPNNLVFMCTGSTGVVNIAGVNRNWVFGAAPNFGVSRSGEMFCSSGKIGDWTINEDGISCTDSNGNTVSLGAWGVTANARTSKNSSTYQKITMSWDAIITATYAHFFG